MDLGVVGLGWSVLEVIEVLVMSVQELPAWVCDRDIFDLKWFVILFCVLLSDLWFVTPRSLSVTVILVWRWAN